MRIIAVSNQKGGCGKTTVAINLSASLAREGRRVLLVDLDPQGHCGLGMAVPEEQVDLSILDCLVGQWRGNPVELSRIAWQITPSLDLAPSRADLATFEPMVAGKEDSDQVLSQILTAVTGIYAYILIDCPPHVGILVRNALRAATDVIVPVDTGYFSLHGLRREFETMEELFPDGRQRPRIRVLPNQYDVRTKLAREILAEIRTRFVDQVFDTTINFNAKLKEGASFGQPITEFAPNSMGARDFHSLAHEVIAQEHEPSAPGAESLMRDVDRIAADAERLLATGVTLVPSQGREPRRQEPSVTDAAIREKIDRIYGARQTEEGVVFRSRQPGAYRVGLAGDFNNWTPETTPLRRVADNGDFQTTLKLAPGRYRYRFVVDGNWVHDEHNSRIESNEFGELNSIVEVT
jgi:chromosome partitioning protein